ncbi:MAG: haloacid dehalogenase-like hydrolase [Chloroflexi bacterium]|nr:haloacid dehalogenase-like hydrolase [Chloroflexota bacterium]
MTVRLLLWDVDGTLVVSQRLVGEVYIRAAVEAYDLQEDLKHVEWSGKTDSQIVLEALALHGWSEADTVARLDRFRERYLSGLEAVRERLVEDMPILPGVQETLTRLAAPDVAQSLLTGNYEPAARLKLGAVGLDHHFDFRVGAFGSDHRDRTKLAPIAIEKAQRAYGVSIAPADVVVIGDTPRDIACARAGGARIVAVATGHFSADVLAEHRPDALLPSLADTEAALAAILGR